MPNYGEIKNAFGHIDKWNFKEQYVQDDENQAFSGAFLKGESTLIAVGPSNWKDAQKGSSGSSVGGNIAGIGLVPQMNVQQQLPVQRILEIGSRRAHFIDGVPVGAGSLSRLLYNGPSLMRALYYMGYEHDGGITDVARRGLTSGSPNANQSYIAGAVAPGAKASAVYRQDANNYLWLSVWDERLTLPFGLVQIFEDGAGRYAGALYLENAKIQSHTFGVAAGANMIMEQISFLFDRAIPVNISPISS